MASSGGEGVRIIDKFNGENFGMWKFKMEMILVEKDLREVVDGSEEPPSEDADPKTKKAFERKEKKAFALIAINLVDRQIAHIRHCKGPAQAWATLCNIHETKSLSNILFLWRKFFTSKMQEEDDLLDHINKVKALADELACLETPVTEGDVVMTLLESLPPSYEFFITALETRATKDLTMEFVTARLMHEVTKRKESESQEEGSALVSRHGKGGTTKALKETRTCFKCVKSSHIAKHCRSSQAKDKESAHQASKGEEEDEFAFATHGGGEKANMFTWIVDSGATQHMTSHQDAFHTYRPISGKRIYLGDNGMVEALGMGEILVEVQVKGLTKKIRIEEVHHVPKLHANLLSVSKLSLGGLCWI